MKKIKQNINQEKMFMSAKRIACGYDVDPKWAIQKWLSEPTTLEFIQLWETLHNLDFNKNAFIDLCSSALNYGSFPSISELKKECNIKSMFMDKEYNGNVYIHKDLAIDFASWISPSFRTYCLLIMQNNSLCESCNFVSEEDFIIGSKTLARYTKKQAIENYRLELCNFVYNCSSI